MLNLSDLRISPFPAGIVNLNTWAVLDKLQAKYPNLIVYGDYARASCTNHYTPKDMLHVIYDDVSIVTELSRIVKSRSFVSIHSDKRHKKENGGNLVLLSAKFSDMSETDTSESYLTEDEIAVGKGKSDLPRDVPPIPYDSDQIMDTEISDYIYEYSIHDISMRIHIVPKDKAQDYLTSLSNKTSLISSRCMILGNNFVPIDDKCISSIKNRSMDLEGDLNGREREIYMYLQQLGWKKSGIAVFKKAALTALDSGIMDTLNYMITPNAVLANTFTATVGGGNATS